MSPTTLLQHYTNIPPHHQNYCTNNRPNILLLFCSRYSAIMVWGKANARSGEFQSYRFATGVHILAAEVCKFDCHLGKRETVLQKYGPNPNLISIKVQRIRWIDAVRPVSAQVKLIKIYVSRDGSSHACLFSGKIALVSMLIYNLHGGTTGRSYFWPPLLRGDSFRTFDASSVAMCSSHVDLVTGLIHLGQKNYLLPTASIFKS